MKIFKVLHEPSGLYWKGGDVPYCNTYNLRTMEEEKVVPEVLKDRFSKNGKNWNQINHVKAAIKNIKNSKWFKNILPDCKLEEFEIVQVGSEEII